ncbi:MAG: aminopeptidase P family protein [Veillonella sp.]|uniref:M24 family metallopeptidase n=1 Tax=Veillonella sp. TaxID=1926307 RepID=UPI0025DCF34C|nr:Xaa-Pro peptidase family protein [Veillonella sp.]MBS4912760.1 aminopeptidase P family protein [Veillonella sp.]
MNGLHRLQDFLKAENYDASIILSETNLRYFTGFTGTTAVAFITRTDAYLITDSRYRIQAANQCEGYEVIQYKDSIWQTIKELINDSGTPIATCIIEGDSMPVDTYKKMSEALTDIKEFKSVNLATVRAVKREDELELMRYAAKIADEAFAAMLKQLKVGMTENEARIILEKEMMDRGSEEPSFKTIVASGIRSNMPHGVASDKVIEDGDFVTFDFGSVYKGYHSDMTRTIVMGTASEFQKFLYNTILESQMNGVKAVKAGITGRDLDEACRANFKAREDLKDLVYQHGTGHGVGLDIHEEPVASPKSDTVLEPNMIITVEPGIYLEGCHAIDKFNDGDCGLRIEDTVIVTDNGCEIITHTTKELIEVKG